MHAPGRKPLAATLLAILYLALALNVYAHDYAQSGNSASVTGVVVDQSGAVVPKATVEIQNPVSGLTRSALTDNAGRFTFSNVPFNPYHLTVTEKGFANYVHDIDVRSAVPLNLSISLKVENSSEVVTVEATAEDLLENTSTFHTDVDRDQFDKIPLESHPHRSARW